MSSISNSTTAKLSSFDATQFHSELDTVREEGAISITNALTLLTSLDATGLVPGQAGAMTLVPPKGMMNASDLTLRIGLLQDALNELMQQVSKNEIQGRLNDLNRANMEQLDKMKEQMKEIENSVKKQKEADKKSNTFAAIANFFKAAFDIVCAVFSAVAAVGYLFVNPAAAVGLAVSALALAASGICNMVVAIDAAMAAATGKGFLSDTDKKNLEKATEILGYIALVAGVLSGIAVIVSAARTGAAMAGKELMKHGLEAGNKAIAKEVLNAGKQAIQEITRDFFKQAAKEALKEASKEAAEQTAKVFLEQAAKVAARESINATASEATKAGLNAVVKQAITSVVKEAMKPMLQEMIELSLKQSVAAILLAAPSAITSGVGDVKEAKLDEEAADARLEADKAEAQAKSIEAMITMLRNMIEQLQSDLEDMMEAAMETVSAIFKAADDSASSMKELMHFQPN
jgi:hypothetical protein